MAFGALDGLRKAVSIEGVSEGTLARQSVLRTYFLTPDDLVAAVVASVNALDGTDLLRVADLVMTGFSEALPEDAPPEDRERGFVEMLRVNYEQQFRQTVVPAAWVAHAAAAVYSKSFTADPEIPVTREDKDLAEKILAARRGFYGEMALAFGGMLELALLGFGRQPRSGFDVKTITALMHALNDGMVLRELIEPGIASSATVAKAMFQLAWALTLPIESQRDERETGQSDDALINCAVEIFAEGGSATVSACASALALDPAETVEATKRFPTSLDLIDAVVRHVTRRELAAIETVGHHDPIPILRAALGFMAHSVTQHARLFEAVTNEASVKPFNALTELEAAVAAALDPRVDAHLLAQDLMRQTLRGTVGTERMHGILDALGRRQASDPPAGT